MNDLEHLPAIHRALNRTESPPAPSPRNHRDRCSRLSLRSQLWLGFLFLLALLFIAPPLPLFAAELTTSEIELQLRLVWGGGNLRSYAGSIAIEGGSFGEFRNLSMQTDSPGSIELRSANQLLLKPLRTGTFGGIEVDVRGSADSTLVVRLRDPSNPEKYAEFSTKLEALIAGTWSVAIDSLGNHLLAERSAGDRLRIKSEREHWVLTPGEPLPLAVQGVRTGLAPESATKLSVQLFEEPEQRVIQEESVMVTTDLVGSFDSVALPTLYAPEKPGVYRLDLKAEPKRLLGSLISTNTSIARSLQFVVAPTRDPLPSNSPHWGESNAASTDGAGDSSTGRNVNAIDGEWRVVDQWNPSQAVWWDRVRRRPRWQDLRAFGGPGLFRGRTSDKNLVEANAINSEAPVMIDGAPVLQLAPGDWHLLQLNIEAPGKPHLLVLKHPTSLPMRLGLSILEPNGAGQLLPLTLDSGTEVIPPSSLLSSSNGEYRIVFWPRRKNVGLLLNNPDLRFDAAVYSYELFAGPNHLPSRTLRSIANGDQEKKSEATRESIQTNERLVALYLDKPLLPEAFGGIDSVDTVTGRSQDDWSTFFQSTEHLVEYLGWTGRNGLILFAAAEGGAIYPSRELQPTPKFDGGAFFSDGRDPLPKDIVELTLRALDRRDYQGYVGIHFDGPLANLPIHQEENEEAQSGNKKGKPTELVRVDGQSWSRPTATELAPRVTRWNPLNADVQQSIERTVMELVRRYAKHPSFRGVALELGGNEQLSFAGDRWGYDDESLAMFSKSTGVRLPEDPVEKRLLVGTRLRNEFIRWRAQQLSSFLAEMAARVHSIKPGAKLLLSTAGLTREPPSSNDFMDLALATDNPGYVATARGIDFARLAASEHILLLSTEVTQPLQPLNQRRWSLTAQQTSDSEILSSITNQNKDRMGRSSSSVSGALLYHLPRAKRWESIDSQRPLGSSEAQVWTFSHFGLHGIQSRRWLAESLVASDRNIIADGGWIPCYGQEEELLGMHQVLSQLPNQAMQNLAWSDGTPPSSHIAVRQTVADGSTYLQMVNAAPWGEAIEFEVATNAPESIVSWLGPADNRKKALKLNQRRWRIVMEPYEVIGLRIGDPSFRVQNLTHASDTSVEDYAKVELADLGKRIKRLHATQLAPLATLRNGGFETVDSNSQPLHWSFSSLPTATIQTDGDAARGNRCLKIENRGQAGTPVWIQSDPIEAPTTGRIAIELLMRRDSGTPPPKVRLAIVGRTSNGMRFERYRWLDAAQEATGNGSEVAIKEQWDSKPIVLLVSDLPASGLEDLRIAVDLTTEGTIYLDEVRAYDMYMHPDERIKLRNELFAANEELRKPREQVDLYAIERFLRSFWASYLREYVSLEYISPENVSPEYVSPGDREAP